MSQMKEMTPVQLAVWIGEMMAKLIKWVLEDTRPVEAFEAVYLAAQAVLNNQSVQVIVDGTTTVVAAAKKVVYSFLKPVAPADLPATEAFDPNELSQRPDIWMSDNFRRFILPAAGPIGPLSKGKLRRFNIKKLAYDKQIVGELPGNHILSASEFLSRFAKLTALQPKGKRGALLANGYANIVYVYGVNGEAFTAYVYWGVGSGRWHFDADEPDGNQWYGGNQVLVVTTDAQVS